MIYEAIYQMIILWKQWSNLAKIIYVHSYFQEEKFDWKTKQPFYLYCRLQI